MVETSVLYVILGSFVAIFLGVPVAFSLLLGSLIGFWLVGGFGLVLQQFTYSPYNILASYTFAVIPTFLLLGTLAGELGLAEAAYLSVNKWIGRLKGGLLMATVIGGAIFGAINGSSMASALMFTKISLPELERCGYNKSISTACIATAGTLAMLIPPSIPMVLYCMLTGESLGKLMLAGIIPGVLLSLLLCIVIWLLGVLKPQYMPNINIKYTWGEKVRSLPAIWPVALIFFLIMGGIYSGIFTPTEAGGVGAFVILIMAVASKTSLKQIGKCILDSSGTIGTLFLIAVSGIMFGRAVGFAGLANPVASFVTSLTLSPLVIMAIIVIIYLILGCLMDPMPMMVLTLPFTYPVAQSLGYNGTVFGIFIILLLEIGSLTPPIGFNVFIIAATAKIDSMIIYKGILPFFITLLVFLWILILFPQIAMWLPSTMSS